MSGEKRLIDANALKSVLMNLEASGGHKYYQKGMDDTLHFHMPNIIDEAPTVDAVEVVRCKDCKYRYTAKSGLILCTQHITMTPKNDDFCSYGERREGE